MTGKIFEHTDYGSPSTVRAQVCVLGSGCAGATVAKRLTDHGIDTVIVEQGGYYPASTMDQMELNMAGKISANRNFDTSHDGGNTLVYGANVGGASVHYWADSYRTPQDRLDLWAQEYGIEGHDTTDLTAAWDEVERNLNIHPAEEHRFNRMNQILREATKKLGWKGKHIPQARDDRCVNSGHCMQGCLYDGKQSQAVTHIPTAVDKGARVYADCRALELVRDGPRVSALSAVAMDRHRNRPGNVPIRFEADAFVVASGGFNSAFFLMRQQGLRDALPALGRNFSMNPSVIVHAMYNERIEIWRGIPAAWDVDEFRLARYDNGDYREGGYLIVANQFQPGLFAASLPGFGDAHAQWMAELPNIGGTVGWIDDHPDELGEIRMTSKGKREVFYEYGPTTRSILRDLAKKQAQLHLAAGARRIMLGDFAGTEISSSAELDRIDDLPVAAGGFLMGSPHPAGGCRMGSDRTDTVVSSDHRVHGFDNLFVADSSVFPTGPSLDPSLTIMGFSYIAADIIRDAL